MAKLRGPRIVTVAVTGKCLRNTEHNARRLSLMTSILREIDIHWDRIDAVVFPGGFFRLPSFLGHFSQDKRRRAISQTGLTKAVVDTLQRMEGSPSVYAIAGLTSPAPQWRGQGMGDQFCAAWNLTGLAGLGRKIFPVSRGGDPEAAEYVCTLSDYAEHTRIIRLASGHRAVLCACYDMFGVAETPRRHGVQARGIWWTRRTNDEVAALALPGEQRAYVGLWNDLLREHNVDVALSTIHGFARPSTSYWQRHGLATAAAVLRGYALGAAHFHTGIRTDPDVCTLAARGVPQTHLMAGTYRRSHAWQPSDYFQLGPTLIRLYADNPAG